MYKINLTHDVKKKKKQKTQNKISIFRNLYQPNVQLFRLSCVYNVHIIIYKKQGHKQTHTDTHRDK